ncbi:uncharacterized protein LOC123658676 [Melitaea cinxia]|uniref:uncharacterized protein LOC123658676 n=1 Tax=Melitaea cinxia TaxID=113334 RepID=UPI001E271BCF|nr:uncharacterized protein LOC123658676 [Melitaea cinxia]
MAATTTPKHREFQNINHASLFAPCKVSDSSCLEQTVNAALPRILTGIPELGVDSADPLFNDIIEENLPKLKLILFNSTVTGFKDCRLSNITFNEDMTSVRCNAYCPSFHLHGQYDISGQLILLPIQGNGDFTFHTGLFLVTVDTQLEKIKGNDGKTHFVIKKFKVDSVPTKPIIYEFTNLFNGKKEQGSITSPCKRNDLKCFENGLKTIVLQVVRGIPDFGIESSDPQFLENIEGVLSGLNYTLYNSTISGYAKCKFINLKFREDFRHVYSEVNCPHLSISGDYEISGQLISIPVEEKGHFNAESEYNLTSEYNTEIIKSSDTKSNLHVKDFKVKPELLSIKIHFGNLSNGQKDLADTVHKLSQEKWQEITELLENAVWNASFQKMVNNVNKFLEYFTLDVTP